MIVKFTSTKTDIGNGENWANASVIGFKDHPRSCEEQIPAGAYYLAFRADGSSAGYVRASDSDLTPIRHYSSIAPATDESLDVGLSSQSSGGYTTEWEQMFLRRDVYWTEHFEDPPRDVVHYLDQYWGKRTVTGLWTNQLMAHREGSAESTSVKSWSSSNIEITSWVDVQVGISYLSDPPEPTEAEIIAATLNHWSGPSGSAIQTTVAINDRSYATGNPPQKALDADNYIYILPCTLSIGTSLYQATGFEEGEAEFPLPDYWLGTGGPEGSFTIGPDPYIDPPSGGGTTQSLIFDVSGTEVTFNSADTGIAAHVSGYADGGTKIMVVGCVLPYANKAFYAVSKDGVAVTKIFTGLSDGRHALGVNDPEGNPLYGDGNIYYKKSDE